MLNIREAIVIGTSAGGIKALEKILSGLPATFSLPIIVVLHISAEYPSQLAELFRNKISLGTKEAEEKDLIKKGMVYFAPPGYHLLIEKDKSFSLTTEAPVHFSRPSIDVMFDSAADAFGEGLVGIILTGASRDGALGLRKIKEAGGLTVVQQPDTAEEPLMPKSALPYVNQEYVLDLKSIASLLAELHTNRKNL
ncbi:MAG TPA: chemotaxis protein CheB [Bacteriovoracaceae bacterium]|nr:chemotaxis protein CheB [Bacteriovoracaceae bacterium]